MMIIPLSHRKKALFVIDVQSIFLRPENRGVIDAIEKIISQVPYEGYVEAVFYAPSDSLWSRQLSWSTSREDAVSDPRIQEALRQKNAVYVEKTTKSAFKGNVDLASWLKEKEIKEIHMVGLDTNDCVLATAYESFDLGYFTYVIEEGVRASEGSVMHDHGIAVLRQVNLTNHSCIEKIDMQEL